MADLQTKRVMIASRGVNKQDDPTSFKGLYTPYMKNFYIERGSLKKHSGYDPFPSDVKNRVSIIGSSGIGNNVFEFSTAHGLLETFVSTTTHIFKFDKSAEAFKCVTPGITVDRCGTGWVDDHAELRVDHSTADPVEGTKSLRIRSAVSSTVDNDTAKICHKNFGAVDLTGYTHVSGWIRNNGVNTTGGSGSLTIVISEAADGAKSGDYVEVVIPVVTRTSNNWRFFSVEADLSSLNAAVSVGLWNHTDLIWPTGGTATMFVDDLSCNNPLTTPSSWHTHRVAQATDTDMFSGSGEHGKVIVLTNNNDDLLCYSGLSTNARFATLAHGIPSFNQCREIIEFYNYFMVMAYITNSYLMQSIEHSGAGDIDDHSSVSSGYYYLSDVVGRILRAFKLQRTMIIFCDKSILRGDYYGSATKFTFNLLSDSLGLIGPNAVCMARNTLFFIGSDNRFYFYKHGTGINEIGREVSAHLTSLYTGGGSGDAYILFFDEESGRIFFGTNGNQIFQGYALNINAPEPSWEYFEFVELYGFLAAKGLEYSWANSEITNLLISKSGYIYKLRSVNNPGSFLMNNVDISCEYQTEDISINDEFEYARWQEYLFTAKSSLSDSSVIVEYSIDNGASWKAVDESPIYLKDNEWETHLVHFDIVSRVIRIRFTNTSKDLQIKDDMFINYLPEGEKEVE